MVAHEPPELPPPEPQALSARETRPLLSVCKHLVPEPERDARVKFPIDAVFEKSLVVEALPDTYKLLDVAEVVVLFEAVKF